MDFITTSNFDQTMLFEMKTKHAAIADTTD